MRINSFTPNFKAFRIISTENDPKKETSKFRGTEKFLFKESALVERAKKETGDIKFSMPLEKILDVIDRQKNNPFDIVMYSKNHTDPDKDEIFLEIRNKNGEKIGKKSLYNSVNIYDKKDGTRQIVSHFYKMLDYAQKKADQLNLNNPS